MLLSAGVMQGTRLDALDVGDSVYIFEGTEDEGSLFEYILIAAEHYAPDTVLLMRNGAIGSSAFGSGAKGYAGSLVDSMLSNETTGFLGQFIPAIRSKIQTVSIETHTSGAAATIDRRAFILSDTEIRDTGANYREGTKIPYFTSVSKFPSNQAWTRQPYSFQYGNIYQAYTIWGGNTYAQVSGSLQLVPCICLLGKERVDSQNALIV